MNIRLPIRPTHRHLLAGTALLTALALPLTLPIPTQAADATPAAGTVAHDFDQARQTFLRAADGDSRAIEPAAEQFTALSQARPGDPLPLAYAGSATTMRATTTLLPWRKMSYAEDGLAMLDKALALLTPAHDAQRTHGVPVSLETRFTAATTFLALPSMFNRGPRGHKLLDDVLKSPLLAESPLPFRATVWLRAGQTAAKDGQTAEARRFYTQVIDQHAPQAERAARLLKELAP